MKKTTIGGQALIEGIMMKGPDKTAVAVRTPDGSIEIKYLHEKSVRQKYKILNVPLIRGVVTFVESMVNGYKALMLSADMSGMTELEEEENRKKEAKRQKKLQKQGIKTGESSNSETDMGENTARTGITEEPITPENITDVDIDVSQLNINDENNKNDENVNPSDNQDKNPDKLSNALLTGVMIIGTVIGIGLALFLFMWLPAFLFDFLKSLTGGAIVNGIRPLFEGILKIIVFLAYIFLVSQTKDIKRVFRYHGAEHKTIFCYENGEELTVENCRKNKRFHPRCGTSFMILMLVVGILLSFIVVTIFPKITNLRILWVLAKILMVPIVCGLGYELIRICGRHDNVVTRIISAPGMWVQRITTKEPDDSMLEVAIKSLEAVIPENPEKDRW